MRNLVSLSSASVCHNHRLQSAMRAAICALIFVGSLPGFACGVGLRDEPLLGGLARSAVSAMFGKTYLPERLRLDGLVAVWHPDLRLR